MVYSVIECDDLQLPPNNEWHELWNRPCKI